MPAEQTTNIKVAVRVRPYNRRELEQNQRCIIKVMDNTTLLFDPDDEEDEFFFQGTKQNYRDITKRTHKKLSMEFDHVFDTETMNSQIFVECTEPLVDAVLNGYNCSVFVYGATGAGKTFTMLGSDSYPGLTFLTMRDLFEKVDAQSDVRKFDVGVSYLEVYNEQVMNLLTKTGPLKLREDAKGVVVSGLVLKPIYSAEQLLELLALGNSNRTQHPTDANAESSRSHAIFQVHIRMTDRKTGIKRMVKLSMIDLAGSERAASTKGLGLRFKEGASINKSLLALGNCINKLADGLKHIPYRDSNLTRILKDSLGGNCRTLMVANVSMSSLTYEDTYNTLKYASRAKKIRTTLRQNALHSNMPKDFYVKKVNEVMAENERLKEVVKALEAKVALQKTSATASTARGYDESELKPWYRKIDAVYSAVIKAQENVIGLQSKIKNLNFRKKLKDDAEAYKIILADNTNLQENFAAQATVAVHLDKHIEVHKDELTRWRKKLQDAYKDLDKLKKEIKIAKCADILQIYQKSKDLELQTSKQNINITHVSSINSALVTNAHKLRQALTMSCKMLSDVSVKQHLSMDNYDQLQRLLSMNCVQFKDDYNRDSDEDYDLPEEEVSVNGKRPTTSDEDDIELADKAKRPRTKRLHFDSHLDLGLESIEDDTVSDGGSVFKLPKVTHATRNLNETHVLSSAEDDCNSTFEFSSNSTSTTTKPVHKQASSSTKSAVKKNLVSNILSEQIVRLPGNKDQLKNVLMKSKTFNHQGLLKTVAAGVQKENQKFSPNRVRKSPRAVISKALVSTANCLRKQTTRALNGGGAAGGGEPIVRINRAASFRVKK